MSRLITTSNEFMESHQGFKMAREIEGVAVLGGCIRDMLTDRVWKDVDLLVEEASLPQVIAELLGDNWAINTSNVNALARNARNYILSTHTKAIYKCNAEMESGDASHNAVTMAFSSGRQYTNQIHMDILVITCPVEEYMTNLPISSSQCMYCKGEVTYTEDFNLFLQGGPISISERVKQAYVNRISEYYPDRVIVITSDSDFFPLVPGTSLSRPPRSQRMTNTPSPASDSFSINRRGDLDVSWDSSGAPSLDFSNLTGVRHVPIGNPSMISGSVVVGNLRVDIGEDTSEGDDSNFALPITE